MVDSHSNHAKTTVADETSQNEELGVSDVSLACLLLLTCVGGGYFFHQYSEFLHHDMQEDMQEKDVQQKNTQENHMQEKDIQDVQGEEDNFEAESSEEEAFSPCSTETSSSVFFSIPEEGLPGSGPTIHGTKNRMGRLPPTAQPSIGPLPPNAQTTSWSSSRGSKGSIMKLASISESAQLASTDCMTSSSSESSTMFLPPALSPDFAESCKDSTFLWTIPPDLCHAFVLGSPIEVQGSPALHARLATNAGGESRIEMGTVKDFIAADVIIGPLNQVSSGAVAEIIGPDGQVYGSFLRSGDSGFVVTHTSRPGNVLTLDPVTTKRGLPFLEIAAEGHPVCLVKLNHDGAGVEIEPDPDIDAFLIVSCVLASLVAAPELLPGICTETVDI